MTEVGLRAEDYLSYQQAADMLNVTRPAIYWMVDNGKLQSKEIGGKHFVLKDEVEKLQKERERAASVAAPPHEGE